MTIQQDIIVNVKAKNTNSVSGAVKAATQSVSSGASSMASKSMDRATKQLEQINKKSDELKKLESMKAMYELTDSQKQMLKAMEDLNKAKSESENFKKLEAEFKGGNSGLLKSLGGISKSALGLLGIATGIAGLVMSSKSLQMMLDRIGKILLMFLRPIADMLSILLMPLLMFLKPMAMFINGIMRPYIQEARQAFRVSAQLRRAGDDTGANEAMVAGGMIMGTGLMAMTVASLGEIGKLLVDLSVGMQQTIVNIIGSLGTVILSAFGASENTILAWQDAIKSTNAVIEANGDVLKALIDVGVEAALKGLSDFKDSLVLRVKELGMKADELAAKTEPAMTATDNYNLSLEKLNATLEDSKVKWGQLGVSITDDIFKAFSDGVAQASKDADVFAEKLKNLFPQLETPEDKKTGLGDVLGSLITLTSFDEMFQQFEALQKGDIEGFTKATMESINPLHSLQEWTDASQKTMSFLTGELKEETIPNIQKLSEKMVIAQGDFGKLGSESIMTSNKFGILQTRTIDLSSATSNLSSKFRNFKMPSFSLKDNSKTKTAQDVILRPNGEAIYTNPNDTIIATRFGNNLPGAGGNGSNMTFNITVNANDGNEMKKYLDQFVRDTMRKYA